MYRLSSIAALLTLSVLFFISPSFAQDECYIFINNLNKYKDRPESQTRSERQYFQFSGIKGKNDLGRKTDCEADFNRRYFVIAEIFHAPPHKSKSFWEYETGICVPEYCTANILASDPVLLRVLCKINNWEPQNKLHLHDPNAESPRGEDYYLTVTLFFILVALCLVSAVIRNQKAILKMLIRDSGNSTVPYQPHWVFKSFDVVGNLKSLCMTAQNPDQNDHLTMFGFVSFIAILWIVAFDNMAIHTKINNDKQLLGVSSSPRLDKLIRQGDLGYELFFFVNGFLIAFTLVGKATREGMGFSHFLSDFWHRFIRVYPGFIISVLFYYIVMPGMMNGPLWNRYLGVLPTCRERWAEKVFIYSSLIPQRFTACASWSWYLLTDIHIYPLVILIAYLYASKKVPRQAAYATVLISISISFFIGINLIHMESREKPVFRWYCFSPARSGHVLVGVFCGLQYYEYVKLKLTNNFISLCERYAGLRYASMIFGVMICSFGILAKPTGINLDEWYFARRYCFSFGIPFLLMPLANDCESLVKKIMNLRIFQALGKLSFGIYLLHWTILAAMNYSAEDIPTIYDHDAIMKKAFQGIIYSIFAALVYHLVFEKPLLNIEAHFTIQKKLAEGIEREIVPVIPEKRNEELDSDDSPILGVTSSNNVSIIQDIESADSEK